MLNRTMRAYYEYIVWKDKYGGKHPPTYVPDHECHNIAKMNGTTWCPFETGN